jgi:hypothetical protein
MKRAVGSRFPNTLSQVEYNFHDPAGEYRILDFSRGIGFEKVIAFDIPSQTWAGEKFEVTHG